MTRIPNLIELGRRPDVIRYVWILIEKGNSIHTGTAWTALSKALEGVENYKRFAVVDLRRNIVIDLDPLEWLEMWRPHYFNPDWDIPVEKNA